MKLRYPQNRDVKIKATYRYILKKTTAFEEKERVQEFRKIFNTYTKAYDELKEKEFLRKLDKLQAFTEEITTQLGLREKSLMVFMLFQLKNDPHTGFDFPLKKSDPMIAEMLGDLEKLSSIKVINTSYQTEAFIKLLLSTANDIRVILIHLVDQLLTIRELVKFNNEESSGHVHAIYSLYAPIAHRLGLYNIKQEIEDLFVKYSKPKDYKSVSRSLKEGQSKRKQFIKMFLQPVEEDMNKRNLKYEVKWRTKSIHSILKKMKRQNVGINKIYDLFAIRIILDSEKEKELADCWLTYSIISNLYTPNTSRLRDWITVPKNNGYESLHTTVLGPENKWVEVQIRTRRMDEIAEKGVAAHWKYKGGRSQADFEEWLKNMRELLEDKQTTSIDFTRDPSIKIQLDEIFVFTPSGDIVKLPKGGTVLDFAFYIHTKVGAKCVSARVNNAIAPIKHELSNGDQVEIITSRNQSPKFDWLNIVKSNRAKAKIKRYLDQEKFKEAEQGKALLKRKMRNWKINFNDESIARLIQHFKLKSSLELYSGLMQDKFDINEVKRLLKEPETTKQSNGDNIFDDKKQETEFTGQPEKDILYVDDNIDHINFRLAKCCNPLKGDSIAGFITIGGGITVHRTQCPNFRHLFKKYPYRKIKAQWSQEGSKTAFLATLRIKGQDQLGVLNQITELISNDLNANIRSANFNTRDGAFEGILRLNVQDIDHLNMLTNKLLKLKGVQAVSREQ